MKKITYLSSLLMASFSLYFLWIILSFIGSLIMFKYPITKPAGWSIGNIIHHSTSMPPNFFTMNASLAWKIAYFLESMIIFGLYMFFAVNAIRLFGLYRRNVLFDLRCVKLIKRTGITLFLINFMQFIYPAINTYLISHEFIKISKVLSFGTDQITILVISLLLIVTSWIMEESYKIHDEQRHTV